VTRTRDDHYKPGCTNETDLWSRVGYWDLIGSNSPAQVQ
jgi:hypothetical protein